MIVPSWACVEKLTAVELFDALILKFVMRPNESDILLEVKKFIIGTNTTTIFLGT